MLTKRLVNGVGVAPGLALGAAHVVRSGSGSVPTWSVAADEVEPEVQRLRLAVEEAALELTRQQEAVASASGEQEAGIFGVHRAVLEDPGALKRAMETIREERINAEAAVQNLVNRLRQTMQSMEGESLRSFSADFTEPWEIVLDYLMQKNRERILSGASAVILAAEELTPKLVTYLAREKILAVVAEKGGRFSHGAVLARSFGIPCIVGLPNLLARLEQGMQLWVDGDAGTVQLRPGKEDVDLFLERRARRETRQAYLQLHAGLPAVTTDGEELEVEVNVESVRDLETFSKEHCDGVGLLRTEFLYMERSQFPSEEEQYRLYRRVLEHMDTRPVTLRTLDIGCDKQLPYFQTPQEPNPALGWRGLRISLEWQDLLRVQLRAALRASVHGSLRLLLPMVTSIEEIRTVRTVFDEVRGQLLNQGYDVAENIPVGIMVEVPATVFTLETILAEVDFISVGSNDLVQYILAVDRDNSLVAKLYDPYHPAVLKALSQIALAARAAGKPASVCGELAGDYATALALLGMGYSGVSVAPNFLGEIKVAVRETSFADARNLAGSLCHATTSADALEALQSLRRRLHTRRLASETETGGA
ncbi:MAG: phosphoenolpyruvate--protein phosphotransferase [Planctomycetota bacterium]|nr:phosphoenolpyruvate--protein phosphotransferase [Planctomycetota bacterium]